jgi:hypothetical protein
MVFLSHKKNSPRRDHHFRNNRPQHLKTHTLFICSFLTALYCTKKIASNEFRWTEK